MPRKTKNYESYVEEAKRKIAEKPRDALREIGKFLAREIRNHVKANNQSKTTRTYTINGRKVTIKPGRLRRSIGYWYRKKDKDLQVGSKAFYAQWEEFGSANNRKRPFLMPTVMKNLQVIQGMIEQALKELNSKL